MYIKKGQIWKNKKNGNLYEVLFDCVLECSNECKACREDERSKKTKVIYQNIKNHSCVFSRETDEFKEKFEYVK